MEPPELSIFGSESPDDKDNHPDGVPNRYNKGQPMAQNTHREQIEALESDNPLLVPSTDTNGHGTFLAGVLPPEESCLGRILPSAPECELIIN